MNTSPTIVKIAAALIKAQKEIGSAKKGATNPFFHSKYADLGSVMEACKEPLNDQGIVVLQPVGQDERGQYVETMLLHESGEFLSEKMRLVAKTENDPQTQGSAISYARRYGLQSMVFIPSEDDDGNQVVHKAAPPKLVQPYQLAQLYVLMKAKGRTKEGLDNYCETAFELADHTKMTLEQYEMVLKRMKALPDSKGGESS